MATLIRADKEAISGDGQRVGFAADGGRPEGCSLGVECSHLVVAGGESGGARVDGGVWEFSVQICSRRGPAVCPCGKGLRYVEVWDCDRAPPSAVCLGAAGNPAEKS